MNRRQLLQLSLAAGPSVLLARHAQADDAVLIVGSNVGAPPFAFKRGDSYSGFDIDVWSAVAKGMNRKWRLQPMEFSALIPAIQTHNIDAIVSQLFIKPERQKVIDFSTPYYISGLIAITRVDDTGIRTVADLAGKRIGTETGTAAVDYIEKHLKDATLDQMPSINDALLALQAGRTDAVIYDKPLLLYYANTAGKGKVKVLQPPLEGLDVGIGFQKGSPLVAAADAQIAAMRADGRLQAINHKWFGETAS